MRTFIRPTTDPLTGEPFRVIVPALRRPVNPEGEPLEIDTYLSRRILAGELVRDAQPKSKPTTTTQAGE